MRLGLHMHPAFVVFGDFHNWWPRARNRNVHKIGSVLPPWRPINCSEDEKVEWLTHAATGIYICMAVNSRLTSRVT